MSCSSPGHIAQVMAELGYEPKLAVSRFTLSLPTMPPTRAVNYRATVLQSPMQPLRRFLS